MKLNFYLKIELQILIKRDRISHSRKKKIKRTTQSEQKPVSHTSFTQKPCNQNQQFRTKTCHNKNQQPSISNLTKSNSDLRIQRTLSCSDSQIANRRPYNITPNKSNNKGSFLCLREKRKERKKEKERYGRKKEKDGVKMFFQGLGYIYTHFYSCVLQTTPIACTNSLCPSDLVLIAYNASFR